MKKIGITGGIGSGKTTVARLFAQHGVPVFNADTETRKLQDTDPGLRAAIEAVFGSESYQENGTLNRPFLAAQVFGQPQRLQQLNALVHPAVRVHFERWCAAQHNAPYVLKEAAILFETGSANELDAVIVVTAPEALRIQRVMQRDGTSETDVRKRMSNQWPEAEKIKRADYRIVNDGTPLEPQVEAIHLQLMT